MALQKCKCGIPAKVMRSWTSDNPGRRFFACKFSDVHTERKGCGFFNWFDTQPVCEWQRDVTNELLFEKKLMEHEVTFAKSEVARVTELNSRIENEKVMMEHEVNFLKSEVARLTEINSKLENEKGMMKKMCNKLKTKSSGWSNYHLLFVIVIAIFVIIAKD